MYCGAHSQSNKTQWSQEKGNINTLTHTYIQNQKLAVSNNKSRRRKNTFSTCISVCKWNMEWNNSAKKFDRNSVDFFVFVMMISHTLFVSSQQHNTKATTTTNNNHHHINTTKRTINLSPKHSNDINGTFFDCGRLAWIRVCVRAWLARCWTHHNYYITILFSIYSLTSMKQTRKKR